MNSLHNDAALWISTGRIHLVLIINIDRRNLKLTMEQWIPIPENPDERIPQVRAEILGKPTIIDLEDDFDIDPDSPIYFEFERVVGRPHNPPREKATIMFSRPDLKRLAKFCKDSIQDEGMSMEESIRNAIVASR
jgi:hypothetical protein